MLKKIKGCDVKPGDIWISREHYGSTALVLEVEISQSCSKLVYVKLLCFDATRECRIMGAGVTYKVLRA